MPWLAGCIDHSSAPGSGTPARVLLVVNGSVERYGNAAAPNPRWHEVPSTGIELLRSAAGGNPHTLVADPGTCQWTTSVDDPTRLALGVLTATRAAYLIHPEHGGAGIAPGTYLIRRQRERREGTQEARLIAD
jgi:hypothetical protein